MERLTLVHSLVFAVALTLLGTGLVYAAFYLLASLRSATRKFRRVRFLKRDPWQAVVLPDPAKEDLKRWQQVLKARAYRRGWHPLPFGCLLHGPPGVGKGLAARTLAASAGYAFMEVTFADSLQATPERSQDHLVALYGAAPAPCLVLLRHLERAHPELLIAAVQAAACGRIFTIGTTAHLDAVDLQLRALFPLELALALPDMRLRQQLFGLYTQPYRKRLASSLEELARASEGLSGRDICTVCQIAAFLAYSQRKRVVGYEAFAEALKRCRKLTGGNDLKASCFMCQGDDPRCPACHGTGYVEVVPS